MDSVSPVLTAAEIPAEQVVALDQHEYLPIIVARITHMGVEIHLGMTDTVIFKWLSGPPTAFYLIPRSELKWTPVSLIDTLVRLCF